MVVITKAEMQRCFARKAKHSSSIMIPRESAYPNKSPPPPAFNDVPVLHRTYPKRIRELLERAVTNHTDTCELQLIKDEILSLGKCRGQRIVISYINKLLS